MYPKADNIPKGCAFNRSQQFTVLRAGYCNAVQAGLPNVFPNYGEQTQHCCHHGYTICHPNTSYITIKLPGTSAHGCNNTPKRTICTYAGHIGHIISFILLCPSERKQIAITFEMGVKAHSEKHAVRYSTTEFYFAVWLLD